MKKILISFVGNNKYFTTNYAFKGQIINTCYSVKAMQTYFQADKIVLLMTEEAKTEHYQSLVVETLAGADVSVVSIPWGKSEQEIWGIFDIIVQAVDKDQQPLIQEKDELILDVSNGFRSLPLLLLSMGTYLQTVKSVVLKHIVYGAYEARSKENGIEISPVFELKPFIDLIGWSFATQAFLERGDAVQMSRLLTATQSQAHTQAHSYLPTDLHTVGALLGKLSDSLAIVKPAEVQQTAKDLEEKINATPDIDQTQGAKPFAFLLGKIKEKLSPLQNADAIQAQIAQIKLYLAQNQYQQAITLARELIVSYYCQSEGKTRKEGEDAMNDMRQKMEEQGEEVPPQWKPYVQLWQKIYKIRNQINHAFTIENYENMSTKKVIENIKSYCSEFITLVEKKN